MAAIGVSINARDHGTEVFVGDKASKRAKCEYCAKVVSNFNRLKYHLGGVRGDVAPCDRVPSEVKEAMRNDILDKKKGHLTNVVGQLSHPDRSRTRNLNTGAELSQQGTSQPGGSQAAKRVSADHTSVASGSGPVSQPNGPGAVSQPNGTGSVSQPSGPGPVSLPNGPGPVSLPNGPELVYLPNGSGSVSVPSGPEDVLTRHFQKSVGKFFFETGTDFRSAKAPSFQSMINAAHPYGHIGCPIPTPNELGGWILQHEVREMRTHVQEIRNTWPITGCSVLLDGWRDGNNRELVNILVDCPKGAIYLGSCDISAYVGDVDALLLFAEKILEEVGEDNVVQIVAHNLSDPMKMVGDLLMVKHKTVFWTVSASHCVELMLERIGKRDIIRDVLEKAKTVIRFLNCCEGVLNLLGRGLVKPSKFRCAMAFLTLENIVSKRNFLVGMFNSRDWTDSIWASQREGRRASDIIRDLSFWDGATKALKAATPLIRVLEMINEGGTDMHRLGYIYESIDQAKLKIKVEFENEESEYLPLWEDIDDIWDTGLHSPLHSAGYFLNPQMLYSPDYFHDDEVVSGMSCSLARMGRTPHFQERVRFQVHQYELRLGSFSQGCAPDIISIVPPVKWWTIYGWQCHELQRMAIRILNQTCNGGSRYNLKRELAEKLLTKGRNRVEQQRLIELAFVHYNLQLKDFELGRTSSVILDEIDPMDDWVAEIEAPTR